MRLTNLALSSEGVWGSGCIDPHSLTSELVGGEWSASRTGVKSQKKKRQLEG
jgi:hypothetical protein